VLALTSLADTNSRTKVRLSGFVLYVKRLETGRLQLPVVDERRKHVEMDPAQLAMLLDGIDLNARRLARWNPSQERGSTQIAECDRSWSMVVPPVDHDGSLQKVVAGLADRHAKLEHEGVLLTQKENVDPGSREQYARDAEDCSAGRYSPRRRLQVPQDQRANRATAGADRRSAPPSANRGDSTLKLQVRAGPGTSAIADLYVGELEELDDTGLPPLPDPSFPSRRVTERARSSRDKTRKALDEPGPLCGRNRI
jgi:IS66 Orf2 like protein